MTFILHALLLFWFQTPVPAPMVIVGLIDDQKLVIENPKFSGFIETRDNDAVLLYRHEKFRGDLSIRSILRIDFGEYKENKPFLLTITLRNGQKLEVQSERKDYLMVQGKTDVGNVTIRHPDPTPRPGFLHVHTWTSMP